MGYNYVQPGSALTIPAPAAVSSGGVVIAGAIIGIAAGSAGAGDSVDVLVAGVFELPKVGADEIDLGDVIYWDGTAGLVTVSASGNTKIGTAVAAAGAGAAAARVRLSGF